MFFQKGLKLPMRELPTTAPPTTSNMSATMVPTTPANDSTQSIGDGAGTKPRNGNKNGDEENVNVGMYVLIGLGVLVVALS